MRNLCLFLFVAIILCLNGCCADEDKLKEAVMQNEYQLVKEILDDGCNHNLNGLLDWSVYGGYFEMTKLLLEHGANVNETNPNGQTPLSEAAVQGYTDIAELLINSGANLDMKGNDGRTALDRTIFCIGGFLSEKFGYSKLGDCYNMFNLLLKHGANVNSQDNSGQTPLHKSIEFNNLKVAEELLNYGASLEMADTNGVRPLELAIKYENKEMIDLIRKHEKNKNSFEKSMNKITFTP